MSLLTMSADASAAITAWATVATALVALLAAAFAYFQLRDAGKDRRERNKPAVVVDFTTGDVHGIVYLTVHNIGTTTARDVQLTLDPPLWNGGDAADEYLRRWIAHGFPTMPPGRELSNIFCHLPVHQEASRPTRFTVTVRCKDYRQRQQPDEQYELDLDVISAQMSITRHTVHELNDTLGKLNKTLESVVSRGFFSGSGLRVFTMSTDEREQREREGMEEHERRLEERERLAERLKSEGQAEE
ncbi:MAG TPA: hypothetical protein VFH54_14945 [Mycobacteriales bacterium]|nr:hypothetical protein [Mycobacteriales bacterium]